MERLCRSLYIPCAFLRMPLLAALIAFASAYSGYDLWWSLAFGAGSLVLMQIGYFGALLILVFVRSENRD
jgi:hypothetical protein